LSCVAGAVSSGGFDALGVADGGAQPLPVSRTTFITDKVLFSMEPEEIIKTFLKPQSEGGIYSDASLIALLGHAESGKLSYFSCCCFAGIPTARHPLQGEIRERFAIMEGLQEGHEDRAFPNCRWLDASHAFLELGATDEARRAGLIPLVKAEIMGRAATVLLAGMEAPEMVEV
jgi:hypothetical protein